MADWSNFCYKDGFEPEIVVGMYDRWLSQLATGPTQADRALVHTPMMEVAHERRFVVCEGKREMVDFEAEHCLRIEQAIARLQSHFAQHPADEPENSIPHHPEALIGLTLLPTDLASFDTHPGLDWTSDMAWPPFERMLKHPSPTPMSQEAATTIEMQSGMPLVVDDAEDTVDNIYEECLDCIRIARRKSRNMASGRPLQMRVVRVRRDTVLWHRDEINESDPTDPRPSAKRAKR